MMMKTTGQMSSPLPPASSCVDGFSCVDETGLGWLWLALFVFLLQQGLSVEPNFMGFGFVSIRYGPVSDKVLRR